MRKLIVGVLGLAALASSVWAADLPVQVQPYVKAPPPLPPFSWTGCFAGGHGGVLWTRKDWTQQPPAAVAALGSQDGSSWLGGGEVGCDYQFNSWLVVGVQGDYAWTDARSIHSDLVIGTWDRTRIKSLASVTGRVGYAWDHWLVYGRGGAAWVHETYDRFVPATTALFDTAQETRQGWTAGGGVEYAINRWLTMFVEYNYYDFGSNTLNFTTGAGAFSANIAIDQRVQVARGGFNFRWGGY
jgi:outer membrane immunogenic protein